MDTEVETEQRTAQVVVEPKAVAVGLLSPWERSGLIFLRTSLRYSSVTSTSLSSEFMVLCSINPMLIPEASAPINVENATAL